MLLVIYCFLFGWKYLSLRWKIDLFVLNANVLAHCTNVHANCFSSFRLLIDLRQREITFLRHQNNNILTELNLPLSRKTMKFT